MTQTFRQSTQLLVVLVLAALAGCGPHAYNPLAGGSGSRPAPATANDQSGGSSKQVVLGWGNSSFLQVGDVSPDFRRILPTVLVNDVRFVLAGGVQSLAIRKDGSVLYWGTMFFNGAPLVRQANPTLMEGLERIVAVAGGFDHSLALRSDGRIFAWGSNVNGQLGRDFKERLASTEPLEVPGISNAIAIACGGRHSVALLADGSVLTWGAASAGQLGLGAPPSNLNQSQFKPEKVPGLSKIVAVSAMADNTVVLRSDGKVFGWGDNISGELTTALNSFDPILIAGLNDVTAISIGMGLGLALTKTGEVFAWGANADGQLGVPPDTFGKRLSAALVPGIPRMRMVGAGYRTGYALAEDGSVFAWGNNSDGQLGDINLDPAPRRISGLSNVTSISAGFSHALATSTEPPAPVAPN